MAVKAADAVVFLATDDTGLKKGLKQADTEIGGWGSKIGNVVGGAALGITAAVGAAVVGATAAIGASALDVSNQTKTAAADLAASLGIQAGEAAAYAEAARDVFGNNFAESVADAATGVKAIAQQLGLAADDPALKTLTENAFRLRDVFGTDVNESVSAVKTLMENFGITADEAFDMVAAGYQQGLDRSGDFLDTIGEYSTQFASGGASAEQFFSTLTSGLQGGMLGTDKAADLFKEFRVRIQDGSKSTSEALAAIGLDADAMAAGFADGSLTAVDAFNQVQAALKNTGDQNVQFQAGVALLGTQFEDLGQSAVFGIDTAAVKLDSMGNAIESLDAKYTTFGSVVSGIWRRLVVSISPFTDKLLDLVNAAMPQVMAAFDEFDRTAIPAMEAFGAVVSNVVGPAIEFISKAFSGMGDTMNAQTNGPLAYLRRWFDENMPRIQAIVQTVLGVIQGFWDAHGARIMAVVGTLLGWMVRIFDTQFRTILDVVTAILQVLTGDFEGAGQTMRNIVSRWWEFFRDAFSAIKRQITSIDWGGIGRAVVDGIWRGMQNSWGRLQSWFDNKLQEMRNMLPFSEPKDPSSPLRGLADSGAAIVDQIRSGIEAAGALVPPGLDMRAAGVGGSTSAFNITINVNGGDAAGVGVAARDGVLSALRAAGVR
jgi:phage-related minor tail protein